MSVLTHSDQVFLGLPLLLELEIVILVMEFMHEEERATFPYHLKRLLQRAAVTSCTPNIAQSVSTDTSSSSLTPQIQRTIDLSFRQSRCKSGAVGAQVSLQSMYTKICSCHKHQTFLEKLGECPIYNFHRQLILLKLKIKKLL